MQPKNYVVSVALATSLGINGILIGAGVAEGSSWSEPKKARVTTSVPESNPVAVAIWNKVDLAMCPLAITQEGIEAEECTVGEGTTACFTKGPAGGNDHIEVTFFWPATKTLGTP